MKKSKHLKAQSLVEIVLALALATSFLTTITLSFSFISNRNNDYLQKRDAFNILKAQQQKNLLSIGKAISFPSLFEGNPDTFGRQGVHLNYDNLNYDTYISQEKIFFSEPKSLAYWNLDSVPNRPTYIVDDSGNINQRGSATCYGSPCNNPIVPDYSGGTCVFNQCLKFTGDSNGGSVVSFPDITQWNNIQKITWEAWVYPFSVSNDQMFLSKQGANYFRILNSKPFISFNISGTQRTLAGNTVLQNNNWYHLVATYDGSYIRLYVNGNLDNTSDLYSGALNFNTGNLLFGLWTQSDRRPFDGYLDEIRLYDYALNGSQIKDHYTTLSKYIGLLAYWPFDDALNAASYIYSSDLGITPSMRTLSLPDMRPIDIKFTKAINAEGQCPSGSCLEFVRDYQSHGIAFLEALPNINTITLEMWIKPKNFITNDYQDLVMKEGFYETKLYDNDVSFGLKINGTLYTERYEANLELNKWYLLDFTYDGENMKLYIDGVLKQSWNHPGTISDDTSTPNLTLSYNSSTPIKWYSGLMDELKIYNRALSQAEINNQYNKGYLYYEYFKPTCHISSQETVDSECLNCNPINGGGECQTARVRTAFRPFLYKVFDVIKWGKGIKPQEIQLTQLLTPLKKWSLFVYDSNYYAGGKDEWTNNACQEFQDTEPELRRVNLAGDDIGEAYVRQYCDASNIKTFYTNGSNKGYITLENPSSNGYLVSQTFSFPEKVGILAFFWKGNLNGGQVKFQFDCENSITTVGGNLRDESYWTYEAPYPNKQNWCDNTQYYTTLPDVEYTPSTCWERGSGSGCYNAKFFRFKVTLVPSGSQAPQINEIYLRIGHYQQ